MKKNFKFFCAMVLVAVLSAALLCACSVGTTIYFNRNDDGGTIAKTYSGNEARKFPTGVLREGYILEGWYAEKACTTRVTEEVLSQAANGTTFYAKWVALPQSLALSFGGTLFVGEVLPQGDIKAVVTYADGTTKEVSDFTIDLSNVSAVAGEKVVVATYTENGTTVIGNLTLRVAKVLPQSLSAVYTGPDVFVDGNVDKANFTVTVTYNNGQTKTVSNFDISGFQADAAGQKTVTVSYVEENGTPVTCQATVNVVAPVPQSLSAVYVGADVFVGKNVDKSDFEVTATYTDGSQKKVENFEISGFESQSTGTKRVTVSYVEEGSAPVTCIVEVSVVLPKLQSLSAQYLGEKVFVGDELDKSLIIATAHYTDGSSKVVSQFIANGWNTQKAGDFTLTVSYTERGLTQTAQISLQALEVLPQSLSAQYLGEEVFVGDDLDKSLVAVTAHYTDGSSKAVSQFTANGWDTQKAGDFTLTVSYTERGLTQTAQISLQALEILPQSLSAEYTGGEIYVGDSLDNASLTVTVTYNNGTEKQTSQFDIANFDSQTDGTKTVTVSYTEKQTTVSATVQIVVSNPVPVKLSATYNGTKIAVGQAIDTKQISVTVSYNNGETKAVTSFDLSGFQSDTAGQKTVTVSYTEKETTVSCEISVEVAEPVLTKIFATYTGHDVAIGGEVQNSDVVVTAYYDLTLPVVVQDFVLSGFDSQTSGEKTVTVSYTEKGVTKTCEITVCVQENALLLTGISAQFDGTQYKVGDQFDVDTLTVVASYADGHNETLTSDMFQCEGFSSQTAQIVELTISFESFTTVVEVEILPLKPVSLSAEYTGEQVAVGGLLNADMIIVTVTYENDSTAVVANFVVGAFSSAVAGQQQVEISYTEAGVTLSATVVVTVVKTDYALDVHFLELGNANSGDCVYIKAGDTDILIDAGSRVGSAAAISKYVKKYCTDGILEYVIVTHAHQDHIAGFVGSNDAPGVFEQFQCENIIQFARTDATTQIYSKYCQARDQEVAEGANLYSALDCVNNANGAQKVYDLTGDGGITMEVLYHKFYERTADADGGENEYSVCVLISQGDNHYLFTGDLEAEGESSLVDSNPNLPEVVLFKGGHHGSYTATTAKLLAKIKPQYVCVCCCAGNVEYLTTSPQNLAHSFPAQEFCDRVAPYTDRVYVTTLGRIKWDSSKSKWVNDSPAYTSMNGDIVLSYLDGVTQINCSNNNLKLKDTEWFQNNRTMPAAWANGTSLYH